MLLSDELSKKINSEIKFGASKVVFICSADKDDFVQNCWFSILLYIEKHENVTRLAIKGKIKNEIIKYFNSKPDDSFNDEIRYFEKKDISDNIVENEQKNTKLSEEETIMKIIEEKMSCIAVDAQYSNLNKKALNPRYYNLSKKVDKVDYKAYRELRNKREYLVKKFINNADKIFSQNTCDRHISHG